MTAAPLVTVRPNTAQRCHSEPVTDVTGVGIRSPFHANRRPKAATHLCRFAAKARFDNRYHQGGVSKGEGSQPLPFGRFKGKRFLRKGGNRNPPFLKPFFGYFLSGKKVTRRRQKRGTESHRAGQSPAPTHVSRKPMRHTCGAMHPKGTCSASLHCVGIAPYENAKCPCVIRAGGQSRPPLQGPKKHPAGGKRTKTTGRAPPQHHKRAPRHRRGALYVICFS